MRRRLAALTLITILSPRASAAQDSSLTDQFQVPDSARLVRLNEQLAHRDRVRILTSTGDLIVTGPSANARGLDHRAMTTRRGFSIQDVAPEDRARRLGWDRIQSIEVRGNRAAEGALGGAVVGLFAGLAAAVHEPCQQGFIGFGDQNCLGKKLALVLVPPIVGAAAGAIIGNSLDPWRRIYP